MSFKLFSAEDAYKKDSNLKKEDVKTILHHLNTQQHLPELTEPQVILFLQSCNYCIEVAEKTIDDYFTIRTRHPYIFECASEEVIKRAFSLMFMGILPERTEDGDILMSVRLLDGQTRDYNSVENIKLCAMVLILYLHQYGPANGLILMLDSTNLGLGHLLKMNIGAVKIGLRYFQEVCPVRIKGIFFINLNRVTEKIVNFIKYFLNSEVSRLVNCYSSLDNLYKLVPKRYLPEDYGGTLPPILSLHEECLQNLLDNLDFFKWHDSQKVNEKKRLVEK